MTTQAAVEAGAPRWIALALPEDLAQEIALIDLQYPHLTPAARSRLVYQRCRQLRHDATGPGAAKSVEMWA